MNSHTNIKKKIESLIWFFIIGLVVSGITAFPLESELYLLNKYLGNSDTSLSYFINRVYEGVKITNVHFPFMAYGTDWLAFAHLVIAIAFIGPLRDPIRNIWVIEFGMISCVMIFPLAFIAGTLRDIPIYWQLIDCSFGLFGIIPLIYCRHLIKKLESIRIEKKITNY